MNKLTMYEKLEALLGLADPFNRAVRSAHIIWSRRYPEWAAAFFDAHFLKSRVLPSMQEVYPPVAADLALEWVNQFDANQGDKAPLVKALTPVAADFLYLVDSELRFYERELAKMRTILPALGAKVGNVVVAVRDALLPRRRAASV
ncbi:MAG: hypothetical protein R2911_44970 [Caldilineaceae bacterium]